MGSTFGCLSKCMPQQAAVTVTRSVRGVSLGEFVESLFYSLLPAVKLALGSALADANKSKDGLGFSKRRPNVRDYAQLMGWDNKSQTQYLDISRNSNQALRSNLSQSQLLAGLGNSFSVPVFQAIAENMLKCFNGLKVNSDFDDSDSDEQPTDPDEWQDSDDKTGSVDQYEDFHKTQKLSQLPLRALKIF